MTGTFDGGKLSHRKAVIDARRDKACPHVAMHERPVFAICTSPCENKQVCESCAFNAHASLRHTVNEV